MKITIRLSFCDGVSSIMGEWVVVKEREREREREREWGIEKESGILIKHLRILIERERDIEREFNINEAFKDVEASFCQLSSYYIGHELPSAVNNPSITLSPCSSVKYFSVFSLFFLSIIIFIY